VIPDTLLTNESFAPQRLALIAQQAAEDAEAGAMASEEIAQLAERAAGAAAAAFASARAAAKQRRPEPRCAGRRCRTRRRQRRPRARQKRTLENNSTRTEDEVQARA
jgi:hypothetical protein